METLLQTEDGKASSSSNERVDNSSTGSVPEIVARNIRNRRFAMLNDWFTLEERYKYARLQFGIDYEVRNDMPAIDARFVDTGSLWSLEKLYDRRISEIVELLVNRNMMATMRYDLKDAQKIPSKYNAVANCQVKLDNYKKSGNKEDLIDLMNYVILEFINEQHPNAHWQAQDDSQHAI